MHCSIILTALLSTVASAAPAIYVRAPSDEIARSEPYKAHADGRGVTIWKRQNCVGIDVPAEQSPIPGIDFCTNLNAIYGQWEGLVRSFAVEPDYTCSFYTASNCPANEKPANVLQLGKKGEAVVKNSLSSVFDLKIQSITCKRI